MILYIVIYIIYIYIYTYFSIIYIVNDIISPNDPVKFQVLERLERAGPPLPANSGTWERGVSAGHSSGVSSGPLREGNGRTGNPWVDEGKWYKWINTYVDINICPLVMTRSLRTECHNLFSK